MQESGTLTVTTPSDREVMFTRSFNAPRRLVWEAWTKPELLQKWLHGWDGWRLEVRENDLRPGGAIRWVWPGSGGEGAGRGAVLGSAPPPPPPMNNDIGLTATQMLPGKLGSARSDHVVPALIRRNGDPSRMCDLDPRSSHPRRQCPDLLLIDLQNDVIGHVLT